MPADITIYVSDHLLWAAIGFVAFPIVAVVIFFIYGLIYDW